jgi:hypothetical protein
MAQKFSQSEVNKIFSHIPTRTLLSLATTGVIEWIDETQDGRGIHRIYNLANLYQIAVATQLSLVGFSYNNTKTLIMNKLKGYDEKGNPKILDYMNKLLGIKIGEAIYRESRMPFYNVDFSPQGEINKLVERLNKPFQIPDFVKQINPGIKVKDQLQPITILIINLPELALKVNSAL